MTTYQQVLDAIFAHVDYSRNRQHQYNASTYNLDRMRALCRLLDNPQDKYPSLHIAGSKGKGSTAAMTAAVLQAAGFRTGMYTSPHLHSLRERMRIDGGLISQKRLAELWDRIRPSVESLEHTTTFEIITALGFLHMAEPPVDWAVLEVGLGGRLDATNVVHPRACAITPLSYEHTDLLGHTLSLIAFEKAGIIKPGVPVIVGPQSAEAMAVIQSVADESGAELQRVDPDDGDWRWRIKSIDDSGSTFDLIGPYGHYVDIRTPLVGYHQAANAAVAVALLHTLHNDGIEIAEETLRQGLLQTYWPGRLERLSQDPLILVDSAHNAHSAENLRTAIELFPHKRLILLFGASADKDIRGMLEVLGPESAAIIVTRSFHPRATDPAELTSLASDIIPATPVHTTDDALPGLQLALDLAEPGDLILVTGSIFVVAAVRESWNILHPDAFGPEDWVHAAEPIDGQFTPMLPVPSPNPTPQTK
ncbi:MAG: bifunctional folylpolyglutamate synthase/dihydrofolate synthase [Caldilineales bacterium]|nr:bifunctional folylpolyglutamate synthase/dihydrofolate synthase [Caldilineales bacterium]